MAPYKSKVMQTPLKVIFEYLKERQRIQIWLYDNKTIKMEGVLRGFDEFMNLVLEDTYELNIKKKTKREVGTVLLKGDTITMMAAVN